MTSSDQQASGKARSDAISVVDSALKAGRIVQADRDMRVDQLKNAQTMQDVDMVVRDLRAAPPVFTTPVPGQPTMSAGAPEAPAAPGQQWPLVNYGPGTAHSAADPSAADLSAVVTKGGRAIGGIIAVVVLASIIIPVAGAVIAFVNSRDSLPSFGGSAPSDETTYLPGQAPGEDGVNLFTTEGLSDLVDAIEDEKGDAFTYSSVIYPRYAVVDLPTGTNKRYQGFYWDGLELELSGSKGTTTDGEFDLSTIEAQRLIDMVDEVRSRVDDPESWYVVIRAVTGTEPQVSAYASNDFGETAYMIQALDGTLIYESGPEG